MLNDVLRHVGQSEAHIFVTCHWGIQIKILDVHHHESCVLGRYEAVEKQIHGEWVGGRCRGIAGVMYPVATRH